jgi:hypothetical protein
MKSGDQNAAPLEREIEFLMQTVEHERAPQFELSLQCTDMIVKSAMHDA